jgi:serine/threonine-protein kinase
VYDFGQEGGQPFIVMRYMPAGTLAERIGGRPMPIDEIIPIFQRLADALDEAHSRNVVHRDLKPSNVLFDAHGLAYLSDFGMAKLLQSHHTLTGTGGVVGTPAYMSPEQAAGEGEVDKRSDVYSLGVILYEMLTGHQPYQADTPVKVILKHVLDPVPRLDVEQLGLPPEWDDIISHALAKKPGERFPSAGTLAGAVSGVWSTLPTPERVPRFPDRPAPQPAPLPSTLPAKKPAPPTRPGGWLRFGVWVLPAAVVLCLIVFAAFIIVNSGARGGSATETLTPAVPPTTALPSATSAGAVISAPTSTPTETSVPPTATPTVTETGTPTPTDTPTLRPTRRPPTVTPVPPTPTPAPTDTPSPPPPPPGDGGGQPTLAPP